MASSSSEIDLSQLISELTKIKEEGNALYKQKKIDEAKKVFSKGVTLFEEKSSSFNKELENNEQYKEAIDYDLKLLATFPKFGKSIVRLIKSYSKLNLIPQSIYYGDLFLELDQETRDKFKGTQDEVQEEKKKLKDKKKAEMEKITKEITKYSIPIIVLFLAILIFLLFRKK